MAAAKVHLINHLFVRLDLARFFDSISRSHVHRSMRRLGFNQLYAWDAACRSTVSRGRTEKGFSLPFGFVQSPVLASLALSMSALGAALTKLYDLGTNLSVYMDDILISGNDESELIHARTALEAASVVSGFQFNSLKSTGPVPALDVFNLSLSYGNLTVSSKRLADFSEAIQGAKPATREEILAYVGTVNPTQRAYLSALS